MGKATGAKVPLATRVVVRAMREQGHSINSIAKRCEIHHSTVNAVLNSDVDAIEQRAAARLKEALPAALRLGAAQLVDHLANPDVIAKAGVRDTAVAMGIMIDKARLEAGETTNNVGFVLTVQASSDREYLADLKRQAEPIDVTPVAQLPEPVAKLEAPADPEVVEACPRKSEKKVAPSARRKRVS